MSISLPALSFLTATQINFVGIELVSGFPMSYLAEISRSGESSLKLGQTMFGADEDVLPNDVDWFVLEIPISKPSCPAFTVKQRLTRMTRGSLAIQIALAFESAYDSEGLDGGLEISRTELTGLYRERGEQIWHAKIRRHDHSISMFQEVSDDSDEE